MVFERKKIQLETLGEYLRQIRQELRLSETEVAERVSVRPQFIRALETGSFRELPSEVYVIGFLRRLGELYSIDSAALIAQFKKELVIQSKLKQQPTDPQMALRALVKKIVVTPRLLSTALGVLFLLVTVVYIFWEVSAINKLPALDIIQPQDRQEVANSYVLVKGKTDPGMTVNINGQGVYVDEDGNFQAELGIQSGPRDIQIDAQNRFGKTVTKTVEVIGQQQADLPSGVQLRLDFSGDAEVSVAVDNQESQQFSFHQGDSKVFMATSKLEISTSNAGLTKATLNGQTIGLLGRAGEKLVNIPFFADNTTTTASSTRN